MKTFCFPSNGHGSHFRARHGARLDTADKAWHLSSATPYDPPLTYGGWKQSQALGARIANIIHAWENDNSSTPKAREEATGTNGTKDTNGHANGTKPRIKRPKHKIVIHSSPYLRCIQTSIAVCAGLEESRKDQQPNPNNAPSYPFHSRGVDYMSAHLSAIPEPLESSDFQDSAQMYPKEAHKTLLRVDPFLGEWMSPDYFEDITHPPEAKLMVAGAKAYLLRTGSGIVTDKNIIQGNFPGGWNKTAASLEEPSNETALDNMSSMRSSLPKLNRSSSHSGPSGGRNTNDSTHNVSKPPSADATPGQESYKPPMPQYAVKPTDPIPTGYVAHARAACANVDIGWDSMQPPQEWGDGGSFGEEWPTMHKRFRRGLQCMLMWYREHSMDERPRGPSQHGTKSPGPVAQDADDEETVLIIITHSAGCNALIGAITNQPVLFDVGMSSLTLAERRKHVVANESASPRARRRSSINIGASTEYDVKITASTEHLKSNPWDFQFGSLRRAGTTPSRSGQSRSPLTPMQRQSQTDTRFNLQPDKRLVSHGLWTKPGSRSAGNSPIEQANSNEDKKSTASNRNSNGTRDGVPEQTPEPPMKTPPLEKPRPYPEKHESGQSVRNTGLWGGPPQALANSRERGAKRRWTHSEL